MPMPLGKITHDEELGDHPSDLFKQVKINTILGAEDNPHYSLHEFEIAPGGRIEAHAHRDFSEGVYIKSGSVRLQIGQDAVEAGPGYFGWGPKNVILELENLGDEPAKCLAIFEPPFDPEIDDRVVPEHHHEVSIE